MSYSRFLVGAAVVALGLSACSAQDVAGQANQTTSSQAISQTPEANQNLKNQATYAVTQPAGKATNDASTLMSTPTLSAKADSKSTSSVTDDCTSNTCTSLVFTGDFLVHNGLWAQAEADLTDPAKAPMDFAPLIAEQKPYVSSADLAVCQMETNVAPEQGPYSGYPDFNVPPQILRAAKETGYDVCMSASNHSFDQKTVGLERTYNAIKKAGLGVAGTHLSQKDSEEPTIFTTKDGVKVAIITGTYGLNGNVPEYPWQVDMLDAKTMIAKAKKARSKGADIVVANMHAGEEYVAQPNKQQVNTAHALVDSGEFNLIVGEHAHTVQPVEKYKNTWIVYGMGNNITELSPVYTVNNEGIMVKAVLKKNGKGSWEVSDLKWVSSSMVANPGYRYCITSPVRPASSCISVADAKASNARVKAIINSMGADRYGLHEWQK